MTKALFLAASGCILLLLSGLATWRQVGQTSIAVSVPRDPLVRALDHGPSGASPQPPAGMRLTIPSIALDAPIDILGQDAQGNMQSPSAWDDTGWYKNSPRPGAAGVALVLGHVDSHTGPAVFARLHELPPGATVVVADGGKVTTFRVASLRSYGEDAVPLGQLFVTTGAARLDLLTCSGDFNQVTGRYDDRLIVSTNEVAPAAAP